MNISTFLPPLFGGVLIGLAVSIMLLFKGRVTGISGIISESLNKPTLNEAWRYTFILGLIVGGVVMKSTHPDLLSNISNRSTLSVVIAGLLVGFGTLLGSGCTSGHGVCGLSRLSVRSFVATGTFMLFGFLAVVAIKLFFGGAL
jgi:uncharacterized membrane protein YedE/YeeE